MTRETLIKRTIEHIAKLPDQRVKEVSDFAEFLLSKIDDQLLTVGIQKLTADTVPYQFLAEDEDLYTVSDLKEKYK